jgi:hypothetical protein
MAQLRLIHAAVVCLAACRASEAGPTSGLTVPAGWRALPELVTAATEASKQAKLHVDGIEAWGEPSRGCYATWLAMTGERGAPDALAERMLAELSATPALAGISITDVVKPTVKTAESGVLSLAFARPPYRGRLRAQIGGPGKTAAYAVLACFWNEREPLACEAACGQLVGSMQ